MATRIRPTTDQALAGAAAGHRMAGMEPSPEALEITRRFADGLLSRDRALAEIRAAVRDRTAP
ncbi:antitoxin VbhA family protein [Dietzia maris]|uniref:antitoxin VbhA family protein n=1 Tax=Dietzia maris TaxID=37915 RepID=UPI00232C67C0|nr:antitoxin VbhA family protein [Dietzia maris]